MAFDLKTALLSIAPTLAAMLGGPMLGGAVATLEQCFGLQPGSGVDGITKVMQTGGMTPEIIANVRAADQKHAEIIGQQNIDLSKLNADLEAATATVVAGDRDSARKREIAVRGLTTPALAWAVVAGSIALSVAVVTGNVTKDPTLAVQVGVVIGYVFNEAKTVLAYYFGSSLGSARKNELLAGSAPSQ